MICDDCRKEFPSSYLKSFDVREFIGKTSIPKILLLCKACREERKKKGPIGRFHVRIEPGEAVAA